MGEKVSRLHKKLGKTMGISYQHFIHARQMCGESYATNIIKGLDRQFRQEAKK